MRRGATVRLACWIQHSGGCPSQIPTVRDANLGVTPGSETDFTQMTLAPADLQRIIPPRPPANNSPSDTEKHDARRLSHPLILSKTRRLPSLIPFTPSVMSYSWPTLFFGPPPHQPNQPALISPWPPFSATHCASFILPFIRFKCEFFIYLFILSVDPADGRRAAHATNRLQTHVHCRGIKAAHVFPVSLLAAYMTHFPSQQEYSPVN